MVTVTHSSIVKQKQHTVLRALCYETLLLMKRMNISYMSALIWEKIKEGEGQSGRMAGKLEVNDVGINYKGLTRP